MMFSLFFPSLGPVSTVFSLWCYFCWIRAGCKLKGKVPPNASCCATILKVLMEAVLDSMVDTEFSVDSVSATILANLAI